MPPNLTIAHLIPVLAKQSEYMPLQANELVTTLTITTPQSLRAVETWRIEVQGIALPSIFMEFTP